MLSSLARPDYALQPTAVVRRLRIPYASPGEGRVMSVKPSWGLPLEVRSDESIGYALITTGVFDLAVTEALLRLADPGELAIDVGANIGCMTSALASVVGHDGEVWAFEPSPSVLPVLQRVTGSWGLPVKVFASALSDADGEVQFVVPPALVANGGLARIGTDSAPGDTVITVRTERLDDLVGERRVGVLKLDAERHEPQVLAGAERLISERRARDVIFEDVDGFPSLTSQPLIEAGYTVFALGRSFLGPRLDPPTHQTAGEEEQSYLATVAPERAQARLKSRGWRCL